MTDLLPALFAFGGAASVLLYIRWQWRPRVVYGDSNRGFVHRDAAGRPQLEQELIADTVEALPVGVFVTTPDMRAVWCNPAAEAAIGWTLADLRARGGSYRDLIDPRDFDRATEAVEENLDREMMQFRHKNRWHARDGSTRHLTWTATPFDRHGYARCTVELRHIEPKARD